MAYSLLYAPTRSAKMPDVSGLISVEFDSMGAAINAACKLIREGASVWQIHGPYGFMMEGGEFETKCYRRESRNS
jgi:thiamine pyrophosphate-dependent acetolactate synthase large subunit-like protein